MPGPVMGDWKGRMAADIEVNMRAPKGTPPLVIDGEPFPYYIPKHNPVEVIATDDNVHLVKVTIQVDRRVTVIDHSAVGWHDEQGCDGHDHKCDI
jgi:hypothetical protein